MKPVSCQKPSFNRLNSAMNPFLRLVISLRNWLYSRQGSELSISLWTFPSISVRDWIIQSLRTYEPDLAKDDKMRGNVRVTCSRTSNYQNDIKFGNFWPSSLVMWFLSYHTIRSVMYRIYPKSCNLRIGNHSIPNALGSWTEAQLGLDNPKEDM